MSFRQQERREQTFHTSLLLALLDRTSIRLRLLLRLARKGATERAEDVEVETGLRLCQMRAISYHSDGKDVRLHSPWSFVRVLPFGRSERMPRLAGPAAWLRLWQTCQASAV